MKKSAVKSKVYAITYSIKTKRCRKQKANTSTSRERQTYLASFYLFIPPHFVDSGGGVE